MNIAITATGASLEAPVDTRFGRAAKFIIYNQANRRWTAHDNTQNLNAAQGAGIQAAQLVAGLGADAVITGHCGPKAFRALQAAGIKVYTGVVAGSVAEAIAAFADGKLKPAAAADVEGHW